MHFEAGSPRRSGEKIAANFGVTAATRSPSVAADLDDGVEAESLVTRRSNDPPRHAGLAGGDDDVRRCWLRCIHVFGTCQPAHNVLTDAKRRGCENNSRKESGGNCDQPDATASGLAVPRQSGTRLGRERGTRLSGLASVEWRLHDPSQKRPRARGLRFLDEFVVSHRCELDQDYVDPIRLCPHSFSSVSTHRDVMPVCTGAASCSGVLVRTRANAFKLTHEAPARAVEPDANRVARAVADAGYLTGVESLPRNEREKLAFGRGEVFPKATAASLATKATGGALSEAANSAPALSKRRSRRRRPRSWFATTRRATA